MHVSIYGTSVHIEYILCIYVYIMYKYGMFFCEYVVCAYVYSICKLFPLQPEDSQKTTCIDWAILLLDYGFPQGTESKYRKTTRNTRLYQNL